MKRKIRNIKVSINITYLIEIWKYNKLPKSLKKLEL